MASSSKWSLAQGVVLIYGLNHVISQYSALLSSHAASFFRQVEEVVPPGTTGSAGSNRELLPSSACRQRTPPADSELCILESVERQDETASRSRERRTRPGRGPQKGNSRGRSKTNLSKTPPKVAVDSDSSSSTVTRVTARATVTVEVHTQQVTAGDRMYPNFRGGTQVEPIHSEGEANDEGLEELDKEIKK